MCQRNNSLSKYLPIFFLVNTRRRFWQLHSERQERGGRSCIWDSLRLLVCLLVLKKRRVSQMPLGIFEPFWIVSFSSSMESAKPLSCAHHPPTFSCMKKTSFEKCLKCDFSVNILGCLCVCVCMCACVFSFWKVQSQLVCTTQVWFLLFTETARSKSVHPWEDEWSTWNRELHWGGGVRELCHLFFSERLAHPFCDQLKWIFWKQSGGCDWTKCTKLMTGVLSASAHLKWYM